MPKLEIDIDVFMNAMKTALQLASTNGSELQDNTSKDLDKTEESLSKATQMKSNPVVGESPTPPTKKKRGRPKKEKLTEEQEKTKNSSFYQQFVEPLAEEVEEVIEEKPIEPRRSSYLAPAKGKDFDTTSKTMAKTKEFKAPTGPNKFDVMGWGNACKADSYDNKGNKIIYPEPTEGRPPKQKEKFQCDQCRRFWEAYPSQVPQAREMRVTGGEGVSRPETFKPILFCPDCEKRPR